MKKEPNETVAGVRAEIETKLEQAKAQLQAIDSERVTHAFAAATGSEPAKRALDKLNRRKIEISSRSKHLRRLFSRQTGA